MSIGLRRSKVENDIFSTLETSETIRQFAIAATLSLNQQSTNFIGLRRYFKRNDIFRLKA
ncbi:hypothetical protein ABWL48_03385 [Streptococcus suis]|nr:hypothetical protein [Streptococcus suis]